MSHDITPKRLLQLRLEADRLFEAKDEKAVALYRQLIELIPDDGILWHRIGYGEAHLRHQQEAIEALEKALQLGCSFPWMVQYEIAKLHAQLGDKTACLDWLDRALAARYEDRPGLMDEEVFQAYHNDPRFRRLAGVPATPQADRDAQWHLDLDHLIEETQRLHVGLNRPAFSETFSVMVEKLHQQIPALTDAEIVVEMQRLMAHLDDGHSRMNPMPDSSAGLTMLPIELYLFKDGLFVINALEDATRWVGGQVLQFGSKTVDEAMAGIADFVSKDNEIGLKASGPLFLTYPAYLKALGAAESLTSARLTIKDGDGDIHNVTFPGAALRIPQRLTPSPLSDTPPPLYLKNKQDHYWYQEFPETKTIYVQYNQVRDMQESSLEAFAAQLLEAMRTTAAKNVIIDVRHNGGGNNFLNWPLVRVLIHFDTAATDNRIFVLTSRHTFSAAQNFVNWIERATDAIFVGEPAASRPNFIGESTQVKLPYSHLQASISSRMHFDSAWGDDRSWISPHILVELSSEAYFANRDPVLETVLTVIRKD